MMTLALPEPNNGDRPRREGEAVGAAGRGMRGTGMSRRCWTPRPHRKRRREGARGEATDRPTDRPRTDRPTGGQTDKTDRSTD